MVSCTFSLIMSFMSMMSFFFSWLDRGRNKSRVSKCILPVPPEKLSSRGQLCRFSTIPFPKVEIPINHQANITRACQSFSFPHFRHSKATEKTAGCLGEGNETDGIETFAKVFLDSLWIPGRHQKWWN